MFFLDSSFYWWDFWIDVVEALRTASKAPSRSAASRKKAGSSGNESGLKVTAIKTLGSVCASATHVWGSIWAFPPHRWASLVVGVGGGGGGEEAGWFTMTSARKQANAGRPQLRGAQWLVTCARRWFLGFCRPRRSAGGSAYCCRGAFFFFSLWLSPDRRTMAKRGEARVEEKERGENGKKNLFCRDKKRQN